MSHAVKETHFTCRPIGVDALEGCRDWDVLHKGCKKYKPIKSILHVQMQNVYIFKHVM